MFPGGCTLRSAGSLLHPPPSALPCRQIEVGQFVHSSHSGDGRGQFSQSTTGVSAIGLMSLSSLGLGFWGIGMIVDVSYDLGIILVYNDFWRMSLCEELYNY